MVLSIFIGYRTIKFSDQIIRILLVKKIITFGIDYIYKKIDGIHIYLGIFLTRT